MPVTQKMIGTGLTTRLCTSISAPFGEEEIGAIRRWVEAYNQISTFERIAASLKVFYQDVLTHAKLPPWDKYVRIYANGDWADDLPEDWRQRLHEILKPDEWAGRAIDIVELRDRIDSQEWFAAKSLDSIDLVQQVIASEAPASIAYLALHLGILIETAKWKFSWETDALLGKDHRQASSKGGKGKGQNIGQKHVKWQQRANTILDAHPSMPWRRVCNKVAAEINRSPHTVRKYIHRPKQ